MAQVVLSQRPPSPRLQHHNSLSTRRINSTRSQLIDYTHLIRVKHSWASLQQSLKCNSRFSCLFSDNSKQEQARKALESALGGKKNEFEKWDKEIKRREEAGGGGDSGGGGWFRWFGGSNGDRFWQEAQQISLTILGIIAVYLIIAKGDVMLAVVFNPLLVFLRKTRSGLTFLTSLVTKKLNPTSNANFSVIPQEEMSAPSARESVVKKWGSD